MSLRDKYTEEELELLEKHGFTSEGSHGKLVVTAPDHYDNTHGSLYKIAEQRGWNAFQFDIIKRTDRCEKKGQFEEDLNKTKFLIDLYLKEKNK